MQMLEGTEYLPCTKAMIRPPSIIALPDSSAESRGRGDPSAALVLHSLQTNPVLFALC